MKRWPFLFLILLNGILHAQEVQPKAPPQVEPAKPLDVKPSRDIFDLATLYYNDATEAKDAKKKTQNYRLAARKLDRFLRSFPKDAKAIDAWYFLALSYRQIDEPAASRTCFETVATRWNSGKFVTGAALHLASDDYEKKKWKEAAKWFRTLSRVTDDPKVRHESLYRRFLCFNFLNDQAGIHAALDAILADPESPYRETAKLALARFHQNAKNYQRAFTLFVQLSSSKKQETASDATLQAALCAQALNDKKQSIIWFEKSLNHPGLADWRGQTQLTLMNLHYQEKNYAEVSRIFEKGHFKLEGQPHLQRLIMATKSYETLGKDQHVLKLYEEISRLAPKSDTGFQATYQLLLRDHTAKKHSFQKQAANFITRHEKERANDRRLHSARLLLAEHYYSAQDYRRALHHFQNIDPKLIDSTNLLGVRYHETKCYLALDMDSEAFASINSFQKSFPESAQLLQLRLQRAEILSKFKRDDEALIDYQFVLKGTKDNKLKAILLQRLSAIYQEKGEHKKFNETQRTILLLPGISDQSKATAHFYLGLEDFRQKNYPQAQSELRIARKLRPKDFAGKVGPLLIRCAYHAGELETLEQEITALKKADPKAKPPLPILQWLGATLSKKGEHQRAWPFLHDSLLEPKEAPPLIWKLYADSSLATGHPSDALRATNERLKLETHPYRKAETLYQKARAHNELKQYNNARQATSDALDLHPKGELDLDLRLFAGDIDMASKKPEEALRHFVVVESLYAKTKERKIAATERIITALQVIGTPKAKAKLPEYQEELLQLKTKAP